MFLNTGLPKKCAVEQRRRIGGVEDLYMCQGLNSHYFHIIGDKLINPIVGVYIPIIRIPMKRWDDHPQKNATTLTMAHMLIHFHVVMIVNSNLRDSSWYPFSHNHGSAVNGSPKWKETLVGGTPIFHFHDYGRKGIWNLLLSKNSGLPN